MIKSNMVLDAKGLACPMPIIKTKKTIKEMEPGHVLEIQATDKGSTADLKAWAVRTGHQYLGTIDQDGVLNHYLRKATSLEEKEEIKYDVTISNEELERKLATDKNFLLVDVREEAEYTFNHVPGSISIPMGELENRMNELNKEDDIFVICRTASRSDLVCQLLKDKGFTSVTNVVPGMSKWTGPTERNV